MPKGSFSKVRDGYNYQKSIWRFEILYGTNTLHNSSIMIINYKNKRFIDYHKIGRLKYLSIFGRELLTF